MTRIVAVRDRVVAGVSVDDMTLTQTQQALRALADSLGTCRVSLPGADSLVTAAQLGAIAESADPAAALAALTHSPIDTSTLRDFIAALDDALGVRRVAAAPPRLDDALGASPTSAVLRLDESVWIDVFQRAADYGSVPATRLLGEWTTHPTADRAPLALRLSAPRAPLPPRPTSEERRLAALTANPEGFFSWPLTLQHDLSLATMLVRLRPGLFARLDESLRSDVTLSTLAVRLSLDNFACLAGAAAADVTIARAFIARQPDAWRSVPAPLCFDPDILRVVLHARPGFFYLLPVASQAEAWVRALATDLTPAQLDAAQPSELARLCEPANRAELIALVGAHGELYACLPEPLRADRELALATLGSYGEAMELFPDVLLDDVDFMRAALQDHPAGYARLSEARRANHVLALVACAANPEEIDALPAELLARREFVVALVSDRRQAIGYLPRELQSDVTLWIDAWPDLPLCRELAALGEANPREFQRIAARVRALGIACFYRFENLAELRYVLFDAMRGHGPLTVVMASTRDKSGSLTNPLRTVLASRASDHRILYREVADEAEYVRVAGAIPGRGDEAFLLVHGGSFELRFGGRTDAGRIDMTDAHIAGVLAPHLREDATVVVYACNSGWGGVSALNPTTLMASALPGRTVIGTSESVSTMSLADGEVRFAAPEHVVEAVRVSLP